MSRTRKQPYQKSRAFDTTCRCHGGCPWCTENRLHQTTRAQLAADHQLHEYAQDHPRTRTGSDDLTRTGKP